MQSDDDKLRKTLRLFASSFFLLLLAASADAQNEAFERWREEFRQGEEAAEAEKAGPPDVFEFSDIEISLRRTGCYGVCPVYQVQIFGDGRVVFEGIDHVTHKGRHESSVSRQDILGLLNVLYLNRFFRMGNAYDIDRRAVAVDGKIIISYGSVTDLPSQIVSVRIGDYEKVVRHYNGGPPALLDLQELIDELAGTRQWIR